MVYSPDPSEEPANPWLLVDMSFATRVAARREDNIRGATMDFWSEVIADTTQKLVYEHGFKHGRAGEPRRDQGYQVDDLRNAYNRGWNDGTKHRAIDALRARDE